MGSDLVACILRWDHNCYLNLFWAGNWMSHTEQAQVYRVAKVAESLEASSWKVQCLEYYVSEVMCLFQ